MPKDTLKSTLELVSEFYERIWDSGDLKAAEELLVPEFAFRGSLGPIMPERAAFCEHVTSIRSALVTGVTFGLCHGG